LFSRRSGDFGYQEEKRQQGGPARLASCGGPHTSVLWRAGKTDCRDASLQQVWGGRVLRLCLLTSSLVIFACWSWDPTVRSTDATGASLPFTFPLGLLARATLNADTPSTQFLSSVWSPPDPGPRPPHPPIPIRQSEAGLEELWFSHYFQSDAFGRPTLL
jgi:hypothetical protein